MIDLVSVPQYLKSERTNELTNELLYKRTNEVNLSSYVTSFIKF